MYKELSASEWKTNFKLPEDYVVSGMIVYGTWNKKKELGILEDALKSLEVSFKINKLPDFLEDGVIEVVIDGKKYWYSVSYGGALLSEYLHLACMFGSKKNILLGSCGGLFNDINSGDLLIPSWSYGNESTTRIYCPEVLDHKHVPNIILGESLVGRIEDKHKIWRGPTITCQAMMGETLDDIKKWQAEGYYGVEMEAATVFAVSNHFKVPTSALLIIGDNLIKGETVHSEGYENTKEIRKGAKIEQYRVALTELLAK